MIWYDGKHIFRKTVYSASPSNNSVIDSILKLSYVDTVVAYIGSGKTTRSGVQKIRPIPSSSGTTQLVADISSSGLVMNVDGYDSVTNVNVTLFYTKS